MTKDEALELARRTAEAEGWPFLDPVLVSYKKRWFGRGAFWTVFTNSRSMGNNVGITIDDRTGLVLEKKIVAFPR